MPIRQQSVCVFILLQGAIDLDEEQERNYRAICRAIIVAGYDGDVGHEFRPKGDLMAAPGHTFTVCDCG